MQIHRPLLRVKSIALLVRFLFPRCRWCELNVGTLGSQSFSQTDTSLATRQQSVIKSFVDNNSFHGLRKDLILRLVFRNDVLTWEGIVSDAKLCSGEQFKFCIWNGHTHEYVWEESGSMHTMPMVGLRISALAICAFSHRVRGRCKRLTSVVLLNWAPFVLL